jgi:hypothetical protein
VDHRLSEAHPLHAQMHPDEEEELLFRFQGSVFRVQSLSVSAYSMDQYPIADF